MHLINETQGLCLSHPSLTIFRRLRVASRAIIGKVDRQGNGQAIFLGHGCYPDDAGAMLLQHYSEEESIDRLIGSGAITRLAPTPENSITHFRHYNQLWERCRPCAFRGGTARFFANYWSTGPEMALRLDAGRLAGQRGHAGGAAGQLLR